MEPGGVRGRKWGVWFMYMDTYVPRVPADHHISRKADVIGEPRLADHC